MGIEVPSWSSTELDVMRVGLGFVAIKTFSGIQSFRPSGEVPYPIGIARIVDLRWAESRTAVRWIQQGAYVAALCLAAGRMVPLALAYLTAATIVEVTFQSSFGAVNHGHHLFAIVLTVQTAATLLWDAASRWDWDLGVLLAGSQQSTAAWWTIQAIVAVYFTSGLSKLLNTGGRWIARSPMLLLSAYERGDTDRMMGERGRARARNAVALASWFLARPTLTYCAFAGGLLVELAAPIGLLGKLVLAGVGLAIIALHKGNRFLLGLPFPEYQLLVLVYLVNVPQLFS
jgi:hypothetical protein